MVSAARIVGAVVLLHEALHAGRTWVFSWVARKASQMAITKVPKVIWYHVHSWFKALFAAPAARDS